MIVDTVIVNAGPYVTLYRAVGWRARVRLMFSVFMLHSADAWLGWAGCFVCCEPGSAVFADGRRADNAGTRAGATCEGEIQAKFCFDGAVLLGG